MKISIFVTCVFCALITGCNDRSETKETVNTDSMQSLIGHKITLIGIAESRKGGAVLHGNNSYVWIYGLQDWPQGFTNRQVEVTGMLEVRHDLPVFIADTTEERGRMQGIPVPSGTDLKSASRRYVIQNATWRLHQ